MYVIYDHPRDYPDEFVVRVWAVAGDLIIANQVLGRAQTLKEARSLLPYGLAMTTTIRQSPRCGCE